MSAPMWVWLPPSITSVSWERFPLARLACLSCVGFRSNCFLTWHGCWPHAQPSSFHILDLGPGIGGVILRVTCPYSMCNPHLLDTCIRCSCNSMHTISNVFHILIVLWESEYLLTYNLLCSLTLYSKTTKVKFPSNIFPLGF